MPRSMVLKRLNQELAAIFISPETDVSAGPRLGDPIFPKWEACIRGPENTPYEGGIFELEVFIPHEYPFKPPKVTFTTKILHCNIDSGGTICPCILQEIWRPKFTVQKVLLIIRDVLRDPKPDHQLTPKLGVLRKENPAEYYKRVREATLQYATPQVDVNSDDDV